jgi:transposase
MTLPTVWYWVLAAVDGRASEDRLLTLLLSMSHAPQAGTGYVFCNRTGNRLRALVVDATGVSLCHRRLHEGRFVWPKLGDPVMRLRADQLRWLCMDVD